VPSSQLRSEHSHPHPRPPRHYTDWDQSHVLARYCNSSVARRGLQISIQVSLIMRHDNTASLQGIHQGRGVYADQNRSFGIYAIQRLLELLLLSLRLQISFFMETSSSAYLDHRLDCRNMVVRLCLRTTLWLYTCNMKTRLERR
jgi:hypothetical protein